MMSVKNIDAAKYCVKRDCNLNDYGLILYKMEKSKANKNITLIVQTKITHHLHTLYVYT